MFPEIVLIGPFNVGKTTIGRLLAERLGLPQVSLDDICYDYYREIGWNGEEALRIYEQEGEGAFNEYTESFEPYGIERVLSDSRNCVIDLGGGHTVSDNSTRFARIEKALAPYPNVVLLLPSSDPEESLRVLKARGSKPLVEHFIQHPANYALAKHIVYTESLSLEQVCDDVLAGTERAAMPT